jgi:16S rRNA (adenine1518-N6/adenine1519-N6)-dimethyltransferase
MVALPEGIQPKKWLDQHFLIDPRVLRKEVDLAGLTDRDVVLEIGAGNGVLTKSIAEKALKVIAIEKDPRLVGLLSSTCPANVEIIQGDALQLEFDPFDKVMGNLPYSISSPLVFKLLDYDFQLGVLAFQHEFARRMIAQPGTRDYSRLSVMVALRTRGVSVALKVPRRAFWPAPEVDSALVVLTPGGAQFANPSSAEVIRLIFCHKRKKLLNALRDSEQELRTLFRIGSKEIMEGIPADWDARVFKMTPQEILRFSDSVAELVARTAPKPFSPRSE